MKTEQAMKETIDLLNGMELTDAIKATVAVLALLLYKIPEETARNAIIEETIQVIPKLVRLGVEEFKKEIEE